MGEGLATACALRLPAGCPTRHLSVGTRSEEESACPSGSGDGVRVHCRYLRVGSNPTADILLIWRRAFWQLAMRNARERAHDQKKSQPARVVQGVESGSNADICAWVRIPRLTFYCCAAVSHSRSTHQPCGGAARRTEISWLSAPCSTSPCHSSSPRGGLSRGASAPILPKVDQK